MRTVVSRVGLAAETEFFEFLVDLATHRAGLCGGWVRGTQHLSRACVMLQARDDLLVSVSDTAGTFHSVEHPMLIPGTCALTLPRKSAQLRESEGQDTVYLIGRQWQRTCETWQDRQGRHGTAP